MKPNDVRKLLTAVQQRPSDYIQPDLIPGWKYPRLCSVIAYCAESHYIRAIPVTNFDSPHQEYIVQGITRGGENYLEQNRFAARVGIGLRKSAVPLLTAVAAVVAILTFIFELFPSLAGIIGRHK